MKCKRWTFKNYKLPEVNLKIQKSRITEQKTGLVNQNKD